MPGNIYNRPMFRLATGGMPPEGEMPMMPMMPPEGDPSMASEMMPPEMMQAMDQMSPEEMQQITGQFDEASEELTRSEIEQGAVQAVDKSLNDLDMAGGLVDVMNAVWDDDRTIEDYRNDLASVVGPEDASQTPDSVLALVQPTLQLAQIDTGIGALMQEELSEVGDVGGGIADFAIDQVVGGMADETAALVGTVGGMSQGPGSMDQMMMEAVGGEVPPMPMPMETGMV
tara:strand:+ start:1816 stop:2502 length:687 start_codon:yes stop_codon:yes gene_type:complete